MGLGDTIQDTGVLYGIDTKRYTYCMVPTLLMDTEAFDFVLGTDFFVQHSQIQSLTLQAPYLLYVDHGSGRESVPLEQSEHTSSYLRLSKEEPSNMMAASKTEDYQLLGEVLD